MISPFLFYSAALPDAPAPAPGRLRIASLGVHETMPPGTVMHPAAGALWLFMFFHTPAQVFTAEGAAPAGGRFIIWPQGSGRSYGNPENGWDHSWLVVEGAAVAETLAIHRLPLAVLQPYDAGEVFVRYLTAMHRELNGRQTPDVYLLDRLFDLLCYELRRFLQNTVQPIPANILRAEEFMRENIDRPLTVRSLAAAANLSVPHFIALFRRAYGTAPMHYLLQKRMTLAAQLLQYDLYSCKEIAARTGFSDQLLFTRRFRLYWGEPPTVWRKQRRQG